MKKKNWLQFLDDLLNLYNVDFASWNSSLTRDELIGAINCGAIDHLFHYIFDKETKSANKKICFIKEIKLYEIVPHINFFIPNAKFVYMVRDHIDKLSEKYFNKPYPFKIQTERVVMKVEATKEVFFNIKLEDL